MYNFTNVSEKLAYVRFMDILHLKFVKSVIS